MAKKKQIKRRNQQRKPKGNPRTGLVRVILTSRDASRDRWGEPGLVNKLFDEGKLVKMQMGEGWQFAFPRCLNCFRSDCVKHSNNDCLRNCKCHNYELVPRNAEVERGFF